MGRKVEAIFGEVASLASLCFLLALVCSSRATQLTYNYNWVSPSTSVPVEAFNAANVSLGAVAPSSYDPDSNYYIVGTRTNTRLNFWLPFDDKQNYVAAIHLDALREFVYRNPSFSVRLQPSTFRIVRTVPIAEQWSQDVGYLPAPDFLVHVRAWFYSASAIGTIYPPYFCDI